MGKRWGRGWCVCEMRGSRLIERFRDTTVTPYHFFCPGDGIPPPLLPSLSSCLPLSVSVTVTHPRAPTFSSYDLPCYPGS